MQREFIDMRPDDQAQGTLLASDEFLGASVTLDGASGTIAGLRRGDECRVVEVLVLRPGHSAVWVDLTSAALLF